MGSLRGPCREVDLARRAEVARRAKTGGETKEAERLSVCGLRRCQNAESAVYHDRDYNAAFNIGVRLKTLFCPPVHAAADGGLSLGVDEIDATLSTLDAEPFKKT